MTIVKIDRLGSKGDGIGRVGDANVFVTKVLSGETVEISQGKLKRIVEPSSERIAAFCKYFDQCGGCKFQHWQHAPYAEWKRSLVVDALKSQGIVTTVDPLIDAHGAGRRRVSLHVRQIGGEWVAGFMEAKSHDLVAIDICPVLVPQLAGATALAASFGPTLGNCDVMMTVADNGLDVAVKAEREAANKHIAQFRLIMEKYKIMRLALNDEVVAQLTMPTIAIGPAHLQLPINSFLQATAAGEDELVRLAKTHFVKAKKILDLFCGVGPFTFRLAEIGKVHGIDSDKSAVASLLQATRFVQGLKPITATARDLFDNPLVAEELNEFDSVIFDPPRAGAEEQSKQLAKSKVKRIVAVACDAQSFARDAAILIKGGYKLGQVTPVDQFKYSAHVEIVASFTRR
jgi:23S rRNA (uracil1939-C5)-methyltransferase